MFEFLLFLLYCLILFDLLILLRHLSCSLHEYQVWDDARHQKLPKEFSETFPQEVHFYIPYYPKWFTCNTKVAGGRCTVAALIQSEYVARSFSDTVDSPHSSLLVQRSVIVVFAGANHQVDAVWAARRTTWSKYTESRAGEVGSDAEHTKNASGECN